MNMNSATSPARPSQVGEQLSRLDSLIKTQGEVLNKLEGRISHVLRVAPETPIQKDCKEVPQRVHLANTLQSLGDEVARHINTIENLYERCEL